MSSDLPAILGDYELLLRIAKGGMAEVFLARPRASDTVDDPVSDLLVVKRILAHLAEEKHFVEMFMEEARVAALIDHPNVVQIHGVGEDHGSYYIAMEYLSWPTVGALLRAARSRGDALPPGIAAEIMAQACDGLHAAHELRDRSGRALGLVHRDVSPQNLVLTRGGRVKLVDFGIAKAHDASVHTSTGNIKGKFPYMSPEQTQGLPLDRRSDIFSVGTLLYELVAGQRVFHRRTELLTLKAITEEPIPDPRQFNQAVPAKIVEVIARALERDPADRYATARDVRIALRQAIEALSLEATPDALVTYVKTHCAGLLREAEEQRAAAIAAARGEVAAGAGSARELTTASAQLKKPSPPGGSRRRWLLAVGLALAAVAIGGGAGVVYRALSGPPGPPLRFGLPPVVPAEFGLHELGPFIEYLEGRLGRRVELVVSKDYPSVRSALLSGAIDFASLPPLQYVLARRGRSDLRALVGHVNEGAHTYQAYIVRSSDGPVHRMADLQGARFCYVDTESTSGYLLPRHYLRQRGLDPDKIFAKARFSGNHAAVMRDVVNGRCDAGAVYSGALLAARDLKISSYKLPVLAVVGELPLDVVCVAPHMSAALAGALKQALLQFDAQRDLGRATIGTKTYHTSGFTDVIGDFSLVERVARSEGLLR